jgi:AcrR family transcriptional regulator
MRVFAAVAEEVVSCGYANASVTSLAGRAGITRGAFYKFYPDLEECVLAAFDHFAGEVVAVVRGAVEAGRPGEADTDALRATVGFARHNRATFLFVTDAAMTCGPRLAERRNLVIGQLCSSVEARWEESGGSDRVPDLPALLVIGGVIRYLGLALRRGPVKWEREESDLDAWIDAYRVPARERRRKDLPVRPEDLPSPAAGRGLGTRSPRLIAGRPEPSPAPTSAASERDRILQATADVVSERGYVAASVAEIAARAGVSREVFYTRFRSKRAALDAAVTLLFEQAIAAMGGAFFTAGAPWLQRIWDSSRALTSLLDSAPNFTHLAFVDAFSPDAESARRAEEFFLGFTIFLTQGSELAGSREVPRLAPKAITAAMIELGANRAAAGAVSDLPGLVPLGVVLTTAPYAGIRVANDFVEGQQNDTSPH